MGARIHGKHDPRTGVEAVWGVRVERPDLAVGKVPKL
jgi:hypothetical protein